MEINNQLHVNKNVTLTCILLVTVTKLWLLKTTENIKGGSRVGKFLVNKISWQITEV
jgi:hypothetical protein